jgi:hypothetical protein
MTATAQPIALFGPGILCVRRIDIANQGSVNIGKAQEFSINLKGTTKDLYGQNQLPDLSARSTVKATGKIKAARLSALAMNAAFFGQTLTSGGYQWNVNEVGTIPTPSGPYTVTVTNSATFDQDLGVTFAATGQPLVMVASGPTTGQYSEASGVYTFAAADAGLGVLITYTSTAATGQHLTYANQPIGTTPTFQLDYWNNVNQPGASPFAVRAFSCVSDSFALQFKLEDFALPEIDFSMFCNAAGNLFEAVWPNLA